MSVWAIVVAAGTGTRFGGAKQFAALRDDATVVDRSVDTARAACECVVVVVPPDASWSNPSVVTVVGGATRSDSVRAGLAAVPRSAEIVVVHDAARPLASRALFEAVIAAVRDGADGAVPVLPVVDTMKRVDDGRVVTTVARDGLCTVQTPQAFRSSALRAAHAAGGSTTDDAALVESCGRTVVAVEGEPWNLKITTASDLVVARALLEAG